MDEEVILEVIEVEPLAEYRGTVLWLHGLGADGQDFLGMINMLGLPEDHGLRFVFPSAPLRPITVNGGMVMRGWFDILDVRFNSREDEEGIRLSSQWIADLLHRELMLNSCSSENILLAGFSQGGALALHFGLRSVLPLAGVIALSTYQTFPNLLDEEISVEGTKTPIFMGHGLFDPIVPLHHGEDAKKQLLGHGCNVQWHSYPIQHSVCDEEISHISLFIHDVFKLAG
ncbi:MAG: carboxylesterase [Francisellaceae bacterium]|jgi:phospholipase/carboxylesterase|nr:carboxylesterase [Francisellaceae bacterium]MBT6207303.1 carboxylesterase [Francisellaceae bacterium]MBT6538887.1 carboxylesterase [Francisellaceae bacterium]